MVYARVSKTRGVTTLRVRVSPQAPTGSDPVEGGACRVSGISKAL